MSRERTMEAIAEGEQVRAEGGHLFSQLGMHDVEESPDRLVIDLPVGGNIRNTRGALQGGLIATLVDVVAGRLAMAGVDDGQSTATLDLHVHYLAPVVAGPARATATILRRGRRNIVVQVDVHDVARDRLAAVGTVQFAVLDDLQR